MVKVGAFRFHTSSQPPPCCAFLPCLSVLPTPLSPSKRQRPCDATASLAFCQHWRHEQRRCQRGKTSYVQIRPHGKGCYSLKAGLDSQDDGFSMWSRPFTFAGNAVRVEEGWGIGIGERPYFLLARTAHEHCIPNAYEPHRWYCLGRWSAAGSVSEVNARVPCSSGVKQLKS